MPNHCKACENEDDDEMVQCDECDEWYHYTCVGVDHEIEDHEWKCVKCRTSSLEKVHNDTTTNVTDQPTSPLSSTAGNAFEASQQLIPLQQSAVPPHQQTEGSPPCTSKQSSVASKDATAANSQKALDLSKANDNSLESKKQQSMTLINKRSSLLLQQLEEERQLQAQRDMEYIKKKYALLKELEIEADNNLVAHSIQQSYTTQHPENNLKSVAVAKSNLFGPRDDWNSTFCQKPVSQPLMSTMKQTSGLHHLATPASNFNAPSNEKPTANQFSFSKSCETLTPNKQQLAARQIMSKEVVTFSGRVEEWPRFISWFNNTTVSCGYTNTDNLSRLQHCLKDDALRTVGVRLFLPDQVPAAMKSLQMLYGRPEAIIDSLLETIRKEPTPRMEKLQTLIRFSLSVQNACAVMIGSGLNDHLSNPSLLRELTERLPPSIRLNWGEFRKNLNLVTLLTFSEWLEDVAQSASEVMPLSTTNFSARSERSSNKSSVNLHQASQSQPSTSQSPSSGNLRCPLCDQSCNSLEHCQKFLGLNLNERWNAISRFFFCRTCLRRHGRNRCRLLKECGVEGCTFKHHKLLHKTRETTIAAPRVNCYHKMDKCSILFRIVPVTLYNDEIRINTYAFLDDGSSISLIDDEIATKLNATGEPQPLCLKWTSNTHRTEKSSRLINLQISSTFSSKKYEVSNLHTVKSLDLPKQSINAEEICRRHHHLKNIPLQTYTNAKPQLLLGLDQWKLTIPLRSHEGRADEPVASKTRLGWTVYGSCLGSSSKNQSPNYHNFHSCNCQDLEEQKLSTQFKEFVAIDLEGVTTKKILRSADDEKAMSIISENMTRRAKANNFVVPLLWKVTPTQMPDSRPMAERRLIHLEKKLSCNLELKQKMNDQIQDYIRKQYARKLTIDEANSPSYPTWYLPIFPVINQNKPGKVRMVWDAAAAVNGISLNAMLISGPDIVPSLLSVLLRFRERKIAICADIKEMFHQVWIRAEDQNVQRFLWRNQETNEIEVYVMQVMTFGSTCSPFCAQYVKNTNAISFSTRYPRAVKGIIENHYVDDYLDSVDSEEEAIELAKNVIYIHSQAGFDIRNFLSNSKNVLHKLGEKSACYEKKFSDWHLLPSYEKILGMWWSPSEDTFSFAIKSDVSEPNILLENAWPTKRELLKTLMSVFDPLGLIANFLVLLKILLQEVWLSAVSWDEKIHQQHFDKWRKWKTLIPEVRNITIDRRYLKKLTFSENLTVQMHIFVDASEKAYAAVVYFRISDGDSVEIALVSAKTKVAPLKIMSIPRLELEAAVLGVRLAKSVSLSHTIPVNEKYFWSDSKTVLNWINSDHRRYKQFVAFRVGEILEETEAKNWRWIKSKANVADEATKWQCNQDFGSNSRWYQGPSFLYDPVCQWPSEFSSTESTEEEVRQVNFHQVGTYRLTDLLDVKRFSKWERLLRVTAQIFRYVRNFRCKKLKVTTEKYLNWLDLYKAENYLFKICQKESFFRRNLNPSIRQK